MTTEKTNRRRLTSLKADARTNVYRVSRNHNTHVDVFVAPDGDTPAEQFAHPSISLTVHNDGSWTVGHRAAGWQVEPVQIAAGHIDQAPASGLASTLTPAHLEAALITLVELWRVEDGSAELSELQHAIARDLSGQVGSLIGDDEDDDTDDEQ
jgi:hypothetical protein